MSAGEKMLGSKREKEVSGKDVCVLDGVKRQKIVWVTSVREFAVCGEGGKRRKEDLKGWSANVKEEGDRRAARFQKGFQAASGGKSRRASQCRQESMRSLNR